MAAVPGERAEEGEGGEGSVVLGHRDKEGAAISLDYQASLESGVLWSWRWRWRWSRRHKPIREWLDIDLTVCFPREANPGTTLPLPLSGGQF